VIPDTAKSIPGYDGDYLITPDGEIWSRKWRGPRPMATRSGPRGPRVCLWRHGKTYEPYVHTLLERTFGAEARPDELDLVADVLAEYGDDPEVQAWAEQFDAAS
jgi:hypothetical protein